MLDYQIFEWLNFENVIQHFKKVKDDFWCIKHRNQGCLECIWLLLETKYKAHKKGIRYKQNQPPLEYFQNRFFGRCYCGKPTYSKRARSCSSDHANAWTFDVYGYWDGWRIRVMKERAKPTGKYGRVYVCEKCGLESDISEKFDLDHVIAIALGGMCFDRNNVQVLCEDCHKRKTAQDIQLITYWRNIENNDIIFASPFLPEINHDADLMVWCK